MPFGFLVTCFAAAHIRWLHPLITFHARDVSRKMRPTPNSTSLCVLSLLYIYFFYKLFTKWKFTKWLLNFRTILEKDDDMKAHKRDNVNVCRNFGQSDVYAAMRDDLLSRRQFRRAEFSVSKLSTTVASYRIPSRQNGREWSICRLRCTYTQ